MNPVSKIAPSKRILCYALDDLTKDTNIEDIHTRQIYEAAGLSANTFYNHFRDKYDCASLLVKMYECRLHKSYTGPVDGFYDYISSGSFLKKNLGQGEMSGNAGSDRQYMLKCYEREYSRAYLSVAFWREHAHIWRNILSSEVQNSPHFEHKEAWVSAYSKIIGTQWIASSEREYIATMLFENHDTFWRTCVLTPDFTQEDIDRASAICKRIFTAIYEASLRQPE